MPGDSKHSSNVAASQAISPVSGWFSLAFCMLADAEAAALYFGQEMVLNLANVVGVALCFGQERIL